MNDIVRRLRFAYGYGAALDAADRIEELEAENRTLRNYGITAQEQLETARHEALEEAARVADAAGEYDRQQFLDPDNTEEEKSAFGRGRMKSRNIAAAIRKLMEKDSEQ